MDLWKTFWLINVIMCGRYSLVTSIIGIEEQLEMKLNSTATLVANYNIAPAQNTAIITNTAPDQLQFFRWGLIPHWAKNENIGAKLINARMESIATKPSFKTPIRKQRCLVLADSFYEWQKSGGQKYPYRILLNSNKLLVMAGIWEKWRLNNLEYQTFSIITTEANEEISSIHKRMPVILLNKKERERWLAKTPLDDVLDLLRTPPSGILHRYRVTQDVNYVSNNSPKLHVEVRDDLLTLF